MTTSRAVLGGLGIDFESLPFLFGAGMNFLSPYDLNPAGFNPLREIIDETIDIDAIARSAIPLHVTATHVGSGEARIFPTAPSAPMCFWHPPVSRPSFTRSKSTASITGTAAIPATPA